MHNRTAIIYLQFKKLCTKLDLHFICFNYSKFLNVKKFICNFLTQLKLMTRMLGRFFKRHESEFNLIVFQ